uniref:NADH-ubiquinone oxidoreductase chain 3 n=1 Tax=Limnodrilus hoffmeisteri TaxID=76587 RepID=A0A8F2JFF1_9ANNE|nr:NADH dehydrogenase subunit 3 [Limnodrilus hoffmeisteri]
MNTMLFAMMFISILVVITFMAAQALKMRTHSDREKSSPFECGFDPNRSARIPFSLRFFLLAVIFIIFDIEIVLIMPIPILHLLISYPSTLYGALTFLLILLIGLLHEWKEGSLNWSN